MSNKKFLILLFSLFFAVTSTAAEGDTKSLWEFASPSADAILYFNTKQPEQAMDRNLWEFIQRDKLNAIAANPEEQLFDTKNRDMEAIINLYVYSISPFSATIEGVANITGNIHNDIQKLLKNLGQNGGPSPKINEIDKIPHYNWTVPANEDTPPVDIMFTPVNNNQLHFRINITPRGEMSQAAIGTTQKNVTLLNTVPQQEQAFVLAGDVEKLMSLTGLPGAQGENAMTYLSQIKTVCAYGNVQALHLFVNANIILKDSSFLPKFIQLLNSYRNNMVAIAKLEELPRITSSGNMIKIAAKINIADAWQMLSGMTTPHKDSPAKK